MTRAAALAFALLAPGCLVPEEPCVLHIDPTFTSDEHAAIVDAIAQWDAVGADRAACVSVRRAPAYDSEGRRVWGLGAPGWVRIDPDAPATVFRALVLHELGHHAGGDHHDGDGVLRATISHDSRQCITPDDVRAVGLRGPGTCPL